MYAQSNLFYEHRPQAELVPLLVCSQEAQYYAGIVLCRHIYGHDQYADIPNDII